MMKRGFVFSKNKNDADFEIEKKVKVLSQVVDSSKLHDNSYLRKNYII